MAALDRGSKTDIAIKRATTQSANGTEAIAPVTLSMIPLSNIFFHNVFFQGIMFNMELAMLLVLTNGNQLEQMKLVRIYMVTNNEV